MKKNFAIFATLFLFSCNLFSNKDTINSNENFGFSDVPYDDPSLAYNLENRVLATKSQQFVEGSKDVPLADNLQKVSGDDLGFDSTSGSIVSVAYKSGNKLKKVKEFYAKTLPQLGWKNIEGGNPEADLVKFERDKEKLEIEFLNDDKMVKFFIETTSR